MELVETRYPFDNVIEFFSGGYFLSIQGLHLAAAYMVVIIGSLITVRQPGQTFLGACSILYFALQPFNNPAFVFAGVTIADLFGIVVASSCLCLFFIRGIHLNGFIIAFFGFAMVAAIHAAVVWTTNSIFVEQASIAARYAIIIKTAIFPMVFAWILTVQKPDSYFPLLLAAISNFTIAICLIYLLQLGIFFSGTIPYGTFSGSGFSVTVAFGGVSIERGHLSRFMAPLLIPVSAHAYLVKRYWPVALYLLIMAVNFSASGLSFIVIQLAFALLLFWSNVRRLIFTVRGLAIMGVIAAVVISFASAYGAIIDKIYATVIIGDETNGGGRSFGLMLKYLETYPLGIGYSGSTYRTAPDLPEINMGIYAFVTQMSALALVFISILAATIIALWYNYRDRSTVAKLLLTGALALPVVFASDILWFGPLWWMPVFCLVSYRRMMVNWSDDDWRSAFLNRREIQAA